MLVFWTKYIILDTTRNWTTELNYPVIQLLCHKVGTHHVISRWIFFLPSFLFSFFRVTQIQNVSFSVVTLKKKPRKRWVLIDVGGHVTLYFSRIMQIFLLFHFCQKPQNQFQHPCFLFHSLLWLLLLLLFGCVCNWPLKMGAWFCYAVFFVRAIAMDVRWYFTFKFLLSISN